MKAGTASLWFAAGNLATFLLASALAAFAQGESLQVLGLLSAIATVLALAGFAIGAAVGRRLPARNPSLLAGAASAVLFIAVLWIASLAGADPREAWALVLLLPLLGGLSPYLARWSGTAASG